MKRIKNICVLTICFLCMTTMCYAKEVHKLTADDELYKILAEIQDAGKNFVDFGEQSDAIAKKIQEMYNSGRIDDKTLKDLHGSYEINGFTFWDGDETGSLNGGAASVTYDAVKKATDAINKKEDIQTSVKDDEKQKLINEVSQEMTQLQNMNADQVKALDEKIKKLLNSGNSADYSLREYAKEVSKRYNELTNDKSYETSDDEFGKYEEEHKETVKDVNNKHRGTRNIKC